MKPRYDRKVAPENSSKGHKLLLELLLSLFPNEVVYQEYPYSKILEKGYKINKIPEEIQDSVLLKRSRRLRADFFLGSFKVIIELQGEFHTDIIQFNENDVDNSVQRYYDQLKRDKLKASIANESGLPIVWIYPKDLKNKKIIQETISNAIKT